jgi:hypothetical protein
LFPFCTNLPILTTPHPATKLNRLLNLSIGESFTSVLRVEWPLTRKAARDKAADEVAARAFATDRAENTAVLSVWLDPERCGGGHNYSGGGGGEGGGPVAAAAAAAAAVVVDEAFVLVDNNTGRTFELKHGTATVSWERASYAVKRRSDRGQGDGSSSGGSGSAERRRSDGAALVELSFYVSRAVVAVCRDSPNSFMERALDDWHEQIFGTRSTTRPPQGRPGPSGVRTDE